MGNTPWVGEVIVFIRQTGGANVRVLCEIYVMIQLQNSDVIGKGTGVELGMHEDVHDVALDVGVELDIVIHVPFT